MLPSMAPPRAPGRWLTADDWIEAGFAVLADSGPNALRIGPLCERLNVTKGSFYWHFADMPAYRSALIEAWGSLHDRNRRPFENMGDVDPRERLIVMMRTLVAPQHWALERAMRVWALTDDAVLASVQRSDGRVLRAVRHAFVDCGFGPEEAALRSTVVFAAGVGLLHASASTPAAPPELMDRFLEFMLRP
jgi:AcrR family transcriptional regulator